MLKKNQSWTIVKSSKKILIRTTAIGEKKPQYRTVIDSEYSMGKWEFAAKEQDEGQ